MRLSDQPTLDLRVHDGQAFTKFQAHVSSVCDELGLDYDVLEPSGWTFRLLPDGRIWASHPAAGHSEFWGKSPRSEGRWTWHGEDTDWIKPPEAFL